jgi:hypothetical protein
VYEKVIENINRTHTIVLNERGEYV